MNIQTTVKNLIVNNYKKFYKLKKVYKVAVYLWIILLIFSLVFISLSFKYKLTSIIPNRIAYEIFSGKDINYKTLAKNHLISKTEGDSQISWENEIHNISFKNKGLNLSLYPSEYVRNKLAPLDDLHQFHLRKKEDIYAPFVLQACFSTDTGSLITINGKSRFVSVEKVKELTTHKGFIINYKVISDPRDGSLIPHLLSPNELASLKKLIKEKASPFDSASLINSLETCYTRDEGKANKNSKYTFGYPLTNRIYHINNVFKIWYEIYKLNDKSLLKFNVGKVINKYEFIIPIAYYIKDNQFYTTVLTEQIKQDSPSIDGGRWVISSIKLNPGALAVENNNNELLLPDGTGAIASTNKIEHWSGRVYDQDFYLYKQNGDTAKTTIRVPLIGINQKSGTTNHATLMHITNGAFQTKLYCSKVVEYGNNSSIDFRCLYPEFTLKFKGDRYFLGDSKTDAYSPEYNKDRFSVGYKLIKRDDNKEVSYYDYAKTYAKITNKVRANHYYDGEVPINIIKSINKTNSSFGVPTNEQHLLTSSTEFKKIEEQLKNTSKTFFFTNWQQGGLYNQIPSYKLRDFENTTQIERDNPNYYFINSLIKTYSENKGSFRNKYDGIQVLSGETRALNEFNTKENAYTGQKYYLLNPDKLLSVMQYYNKYNQFSSIAVDDLGNLVYSDFSNHKLAPELIKQIVLNSLRSAKRQNLALKNPYYDYAKSADLIYDMQLSYSGNPLYKAQVPFLPLLYSFKYKVMLPATNEDIENKPSNFYLTYALLTNTYPTFNITGKDTTITRNALEDNKYYNTYFNHNKEVINEFYNKIKDYQKIVGNNIMEHTLLEPNLFLVTYQKEGSIKKVLFNLDGIHKNYTDTELNSYQVPPYSYLIIK